MTRPLSTSPLTFMLFLVSLLVGGMRFFRLGDMDTVRKLLEAGGWAFGFYLIGMIGLKMLTSVLTAPPLSRSRSMAETPTPEQRTSIRPEELMAIESEMLELEKPEVSGMKGQPPAELAKVISSFSQSDKA